jgi:ketosteroid isomerase-like protein
VASLGAVSQENLKLVESAFAAWNRGDLDAFADHAAEDVAWVEVSGRPEGPATARLGRERMREALGSLFDAFESYHLDLRELHDLGDRVVAIVRERARGRASGVEVESLWGYLITMEAGEMARIEAHRDADAALEAAGLPVSGG